MAPALLSNGSRTQRKLSDSSKTRERRNQKETLMRPRKSVILYCLLGLAPVLAHAEDQRPIRVGDSRLPVAARPMENGDLATNSLRPGLILAATDNGGTTTTTTNSSTQKAATQKSSTQKAATQKAATQKSATQKAATQKAATQKASTQKSSTQKA